MLRTANCAGTGYIGKREGYATGRPVDRRDPPRRSSLRHGRIELHLYRGNLDPQGVADLIGAHTSARGDPPRAAPVLVLDNTNVAVIKGVPR
jgi:hypothetical protein